MAKVKVKWVCQNCTYQSASFLGRCPDCGEFSTFVEEVISSPLLQAGLNAHNFSDIEDFQPALLSEVGLDEKIRVSTKLSEFDRVLGGGFVQGSLVLLAGDPGIGKSTLILQTARNIASTGARKVFYICAEESVTQVKLRAKRLGIEGESIYLTQQNCLEQILMQIDEIKPDFIVIDSIQSVFTSAISSSAGSVSQIRECTNLLMKIAKQKNITTVVIGHVTKEGNIAGPKVLEHMVDCVINFEGDKFKTCRLLRAIKNRFGATSEVGIFNMEDEGLIEITNPSEIFLKGKESAPSAGSTVIATLEGTRVLLLEIQALTGSTPYATPRRVAVGVEYNRLLQILAVLEKRVGLNLSKHDVYINVVGGVDITEPAVDLGIAMAVLTCARDVNIDSRTVFIGEIGLSGEIRACDNLEKRLREAERLGFKRAVIPCLGEAARAKIKDLKIETVEASRLIDAISKGI